MDVLSQFLLSVIIPVYNSENTIIRAISSILEQPNAKHIELILVDDGSTDGSAQLLDGYSDSHFNVRVFHKENGGVSSARNLGIDQAKGKYVAFLDSDDWWEPNFFSNDLVTKLTSSQSSDLYIFSYKKISPSKKYMKRIRVRSGVYFYKEPSLSHIVGQSHCAFLYRINFIKEYNLHYLPTTVWEDVPFSQLCCTFAKSITCIDRTIFSYYMNYNSCMHTRRSVHKFIEHYKSEYLAKAIYESHDIPYEIDRTIVSLICECLKYISAENTYGFVKELIAGKEFELLNHSDVQPWQYLQKDAKLWREKPCFAYAKYKIKGIPIFFKSVLLEWNLTQPLAEFIQYRLIEKWTEA